MNMPQLNRHSHPLPDGQYTATYVLMREGKASITEGDLVISNGLWMLVQEWWDYEDGKEAPGSWIEPPLDCPYQLTTAVGGKQRIHLNQPIDLRGVHKERRVILPSPPTPPTS